MRAARGIPALLALGLAGAAVATPELARYNVVWETPGTNAVDSMPLAGGELGLNVWVEPPSPGGSGAPGGGDLLFYIGHPDSRIEDQRLVKLGRVRVSLDSNPFRRNFRQELDLAEGCQRIRGDGVEILLWADAFRPVVHLEVRCARPETVRVAYESWRFQAEEIPGGLEWRHRLDPARDPRQARIARQKAEPIEAHVPAPLRNLTLGGRMVGGGLVADGTGTGVYMRTPFTAWRLKTPAPVTNLDLRVLLRVAQDDTVEAWRAGLDELQRAPADRAKTVAWWRAFWDRSWICVNPGADAGDPGWQAGRNYQLFRYLLAANRTGRFPTLFNGGHFTFDNPMPNANAFGAGGPSPDGRAWWGCHFMAQNQRWVYWPMLKAGDFDLLDVGLDFYRDREPVARAKARHFCGVDGTLYTESLDAHGLIAATESGNGLEAAGHLTHHFTSGLEFAFMMLEACRYTGRGLAESLPAMMGMLQFYDGYYQAECRRRTGKPLGDDGRLVIQPGNSCEMGVGCRNHADAVAGLRAIADGLLALPGTDRAWLESFRRRLPDIPTAEKGGRKVIALAETWERIANPNEFPQMYAVFPFGLYGVGRPDLQLARDTWRMGEAGQKEALCWKYGNVAVAGLGLAHEAKRYALRKFLYPYEGDGRTVHYGHCAPFQARFPAFWVTYPFDHFPDMDHGGTAMTGLQEMLLQTPGRRLLLLPAWPQEWDVDFKLHAPEQTTVECSVRGGRMVKLEVTPASRRKDVEIVGPIPPPPTPVSQGKPATASSVWHQPGYDPAKAFDGDPVTRWAVANGQRSGWLEVDLGATTAVSRAVIQEISWPSITRFAVEAQRADGAWRAAATGATIGAEAELRFPAVEARRFRLRIDEAGNMPNIEEFQLFGP